MNIEFIEFSSRPLTVGEFLDIQTVARNNDISRLIDIVMSRIVAPCITREDLLGLTLEQLVVLFNRMIVVSTTTTTVPAVFADAFSDNHKE